MVEKVYVTYNEVSSGLGTALVTPDGQERARANRQQVHKLCQASADQILSEFKPKLMIAIGGGGYVPARILRYNPLLHWMPE